MQIRQTIALICFGTVLCVLVLPVVAADNATIYYNLGEQYLAKGEYEDAVNAFDNALASNTTMIYLSDGLLYTYRDRAYALIQLGRLNDAIETTTTGLGIYPNDTMLWNNKGYALYKLGRNQDALNAYEKAVSLDQNYTIALINKGDTLFRMGRFQDSVDAYTRANATDPGNRDAAAGLAEAQKAAASTIPSTISIVLIIMIIAAGGVIYYIRFRKPAEETPGERRTKEKKK